MWSYMSKRYEHMQALYLYFRCYAMSASISMRPVVLFLSCCSWVQFANGSSHKMSLAIFQTELVCLFACDQSLSLTFFSSVSIYLFTCKTWDITSMSNTYLFGIFKYSAYMNKIIKANLCKWAKMQNDEQHEHFMTKIFVSKRFVKMVNSCNDRWLNSYSKCGALLTAGFMHYDTLYFVNVWQ